MQTPQEPSRLRDIVQQAFAESNAKVDGAGFAEGPFEIVVFDVDLPAFIFENTVYVQAPLERIQDVFESALAHILCALEAGISEARSASLSPTGIRRTLPRTRVVVSDVVSDSREQ